MGLSELEFTAGDRVRLTRAGVTMYGGAWPHWVPEAQGGGAPGTVLFAGERPHKPGAAPRPYYVRWDNGVENTYRVEDLEAAMAPESPEGEAAPSNVVPFLRRPEQR
ncbi:MAG TPA: hypothetical protein VJ623_02475 [Holophagaceae bacterium]|nr:hypothetical protein [Holophagaceae bacterium]